MIAPGAVLDSRKPSCIFLMQEDKHESVNEIFTVRGKLGKKMIRMKAGEKERAAYQRPSPTCSAVYQWCLYCR